MARSSSPEHTPASLASPSDEERLELLRSADASIRAGLDGSGPLVPSPDEMPQRLFSHQGVFVTLEVAGTLNGCIGNLSPEAPIGVLVPELAWGAAFEDPRLPRLTWHDHPMTHIEISLLSPLEPIPSATPEELLAAVRPGVDGIFVVAGPFSATLLPAVWREIPDPRDFLSVLMRKSGAPPGLWPRGIVAFRYTALVFGADAATLDGGGN